MMARGGSVVEDEDRAFVAERLVGRSNGADMGVEVTPCDEEIPAHDHGLCRAMIPTLEGPLGGVAVHIAAHSEAMDLHQNSIDVTLADGNHRATSAILGTKVLRCGDNSTRTADAVAIEASDATSSNTRSLEEGDCWP